MYRPDHLSVGTGERKVRFEYEHAAGLRIMMRHLVALIGVVTLAACASLGGPPAASGLRIDCANGAVVGLRWDGAARGGYRIARDGTVVGTVVGTEFADTTVAPSSHYSYTVNGSASLVVDTPAAIPSGDPPYCRSRYIESLTFDWSGAYTEPDGSDLWPVTWGRDGNVYAFFGDGGGFRGDNQRGRVSFGVARITEPPPLTVRTAINVYGGYEAEHPSTIDGKAGSIIAVGSDFYTIGGLWSAQEVAGRTSHRSGSPPRSQLGYSKGNAFSWKASSWAFCGSEAPAGVFCPSGFINFGRANHGAPGRYVYLLGTANAPATWTDDGGPEVAAERGQATADPAALPAGQVPGGQVPGAQVPAAPVPAAPVPAAPVASTYLARVSRRNVLKQDAYEYFAGLNERGRPVWTRDYRKMQPVFTDRGGKQAEALESATYIRAIGRYIGTAQGPFVGQTSFYDAPNPWGPWTTVSYNNIDPVAGTGGFANLGKEGGGSLGVHIVNAWTSKDGSSLWLTYSSDGKAPDGASFPPAGTMMDSFNLVPARLRFRSYETSDAASSR